MPGDAGTHGAGEGTSDEAGDTGAADAGHAVDLGPEPDFCGASIHPAPQVSFTSNYSSTYLGYPNDAECAVEGFTEGDVFRLFLACDHELGPFNMTVWWRPEQLGVPTEIRKGPLRVGFLEQYVYPSGGSGGLMQSVVLRNAQGALLLGYGERPPTDAELRPLDLTFEPGPCHPIDGDCFEREFIGQITAELDGERVTLQPYDRATLGAYQLHTGALEIPDSESTPYGCDGASGGRYALAVARR